MQAWEWDRQLMQAWGMGQVVDASLGMAANTGSYRPLMHTIQKRVQITTLGEFLSVTLSTSKEH